MPQEDDGQGRPLKVMRKRLNGVYSADGLRGPTRRYVLIVALLVGLASVPTLAAITAEPLEDGKTGGMDAPLLPPVSLGPVRTPLPSVEPSASSGSGSAPSSSAGTPAPDEGADGQAGKRVVRSVRGEGRAKGGRHRASGPESSGSREPAGVGGSGSHGSSRPDGSGSPGVGSDGPGDRDRPPVDHRTWCKDRDDCAPGRARHHRPDSAGDRDCEESPRRHAGRSRDRAARYPRRRGAGHSRVQEGRVHFGAPGAHAWRSGDRAAADGPSRRHDRHHRDRRH